MPLPPIAVDVAPPSKDHELVQLLLDACSRAASPVKCVTAESVDSGSVSALGLVVWLPQSEGVRIQVGAKRGEQKGDWVSRQISFDPQDEEHERWTTAGFVVGTLAGRFLDVPVTPPPSPASPPEQKAPAPPPEPPPATPPPAADFEAPAIPAAHAPARLAFEAGLLAGPVLDQGPWRIGGMLGVAYQGENWPLFLFTAGRQSWRPEDEGVEVRVAEAELGGGAELGSGTHWTVNGRAAFAVERLYARFEGDLSNGPQTHWVLGGRARVDLCFRFNDAWSGFFAPGLSVWGHKTAFVVGTEEVGQQPSVVGEALLGVIFAIPTGH